MRIADVEYLWGQYLPEVTRFVATEYFNTPHFRFTSAEGLFDDLSREDKRWAASSLVAIARDGDGEVVCTARFIKGAAGRLLPVESEFGIRLGDLKSRSTAGRVFEFARLAAVASAPRAAAWSLAQGLLEQSRFEAGVDVLGAAIDTKLMDVMVRLGCVLRPVAEPKFHFGSSTAPVILEPALVTQLSPHRPTAAWGQAADALAGLTDVLRGRGLTERRSEESLSAVGGPGAQLNGPQ
ncbi:MAG: hypothetical protein LBJ02_08680 [Bifidobacteriaceae bacterium]|jgi:hypothetical protein|nr:hypothetical protein [Bifidobacteriaceae bacterium]